MAQEIRNRLRDIKTRLDDGEASPTPTVREFLSWVDAQRRGFNIVWQLRQHLREAGLETNPDFEAVYIDTPIAFILAGPDQPKPEPVTEIAGGDGSSSGALAMGEDEAVIDDPRNLVSRLASANRPPVRISPNTTTLAAVTKMLTHDFSQLPVMTSDRDVKGVVSWRSIAQRLATGQPAAEARQAMDPPRIVNHNDSLLTAMREVSTHDYVLVKAADQRICGIVTTSDISEQFIQLTEPFLLLGEIEQSLRAVLDRLPPEKLKQACDPSDANRVVERAADLTFGEYLRLLENPDIWDQLQLPLDRGEFVLFLDQVRDTRNDVMHFDPDGISDASRLQLRNLVKLLDWLRP